MHKKPGKIKVILGNINYISHLCFIAIILFTNIFLPIFLWERNENIAVTVGIIVFIMLLIHTIMFCLTINSQIQNRLIALEYAKDYINKWTDPFGYLCLTKENITIEFIIKKKLLLLE